MQRNLHRDFPLHFRFEAAVVGSTCNTWPTSVCHLTTLCGTYAWGSSVFKCRLVSKIGQVWQHHVVKWSQWQRGLRCGVVMSKAGDETRRRRRRSDGRVNSFASYFKSDCSGCQICAAIFVDAFAMSPFCQHPK